jgi:hypothetical protein
MSCAILLHPSVPHVFCRYKHILPIPIALHGDAVLSPLQCRGAKEDRETRQERRHTIGYVRNSRRSMSSSLSRVNTS